jgi:hypothetical protein
VDYNTGSFGQAGPGLTEAFPTDNQHQFDTRQPTPAAKLFLKKD